MPKVDVGDKIRTLYVARHEYDRLGDNRRLMKKISISANELEKLFDDIKNETDQADDAADRFDDLRLPSYGMEPGHADLKKFYTDLCKQLRAGKGRGVGMFQEEQDIGVGFTKDQAKARLAEVGADEDPFEDE